MPRRVRVVLLASAGFSNTEIARNVPMDVEAVGLWQRRWVAWRGMSPHEVSAARRLADAPRPGAQPCVSPEQVCQIPALACEQPSDLDRPISHWSHRELADEIVRRGITDRISPRHASRLLKAADLQPHRVRYWLTPAVDADRDAKITDVREVYRSATERAQHGQRTLSTDEVTGVQALERLAPDLPPRPGKVAQHEFEYKRHDTCSFMINFDVATGRVETASTGPTRTEADYLTHVRRTIESNPAATQWHFVVDNLDIHRSESLGLLGSPLL